MDVGAASVGMSEKEVDGIAWGYDRRIESIVRVMFERMDREAATLSQCMVQEVMDLSCSS